LSSSPAGQASMTGASPTTFALSACPNRRAACRLQRTRAASADFR
jgi:hypothetical protein